MAYGETSASAVRPVSPQDMYINANPTPAGADTKPREIKLHLGAMEELNEKLWSKVLYLEERLSGVLRKIPDATEENRKEVMPPVVTGLGQALCDQNGHLRDTINRIELIIQRLEV